MTQMDLGRETQMLSTRRDTSDEAFRKSRSEEQREKILQMIVMEPLTCDEIIAKSGIPHQSASAAVNWLMRHGLIVPTTYKRKTRQNRMAIVWQFEPKPIPVLRDRPTRKQLQIRVDAAIKRLTASETTTRTEIVRILKGECDE